MHGDDGVEHFEIPPGEQLHTFYYRVPWPEEVAAVRFEGDLESDDATYAWSLYSVPNSRFVPGSHEVSIGTWLGMEDTQLLARGALGGWSWQLPEDTAMPLPSPDGMIAVEWHFLQASNAKRIDRSAVRVCTVPRSTRSRTAVLSVLGTEDLNGLEGIQPGAPQRFSSSCAVPAAAQPLQLLAISPRLHALGRRAELAIEHADGRITNAHDAPFDLSDQRFYALEVALQPGDRLVSSCTYQNTSEDGVPYGISAWQEHCYFLTLTTPTGLSSETLSLWGIANTCLSYEPGSP